MKFKDIIQEKAKENQGKRTDILPHMAESDEEKLDKPINTREELAKEAGGSTYTTRLI